MVPFAIYGNNIIIGYESKIIFINLCTKKIFKEVHVEPSELVKDEINKEDSNSEATDSKDEQQDKSSKLPCTIQNIKISPNHEYLAVTNSGQKCLILYKISCSSSNDEININILSKRNILRASSALTFSVDSNYLLVCDKSGDCYLFDCIEYNMPGKWILGHLSIVLDVIFTPDLKYIITCDRDEKIHITNFPKTHEIECYCLGHKEYVSSISLLDLDTGNYELCSGSKNDENNHNNLLLSISGDKTMKVWNYLNGKNLYDIHLEGAGVRHSIRKIINEDMNHHIWHVAVIVYQSENSNNLFIYELKLHKDSLQFESKLLSKHCSSSKMIVNLYFAPNNNLYLVFLENKPIELEVIKYEEENNTYVVDDEENDLKNCVKNHFQKYEISKIDNVSLLFKKKFDNISEYLGRKKRRIEEKNASSK